MNTVDRRAVQSVRQGDPLVRLGARRSSPAQPIRLLLWLYLVPCKTKLALSELWVELWRYLVQQVPRLLVWISAQHEQALRQEWPGRRSDQEARAETILYTQYDIFEDTPPYSWSTDVPLIRHAAFCVGGALVGLVAVAALLFKGVRR